MIGDARVMIDHLEEKYGAQGRNFTASEWLAAAQVDATLQLVDAQKAATEQARIANLIAIASVYAGKNQFGDDAEGALLQVATLDGHGPWLEFQPDIAAALGIQTREGQGDAADDVE